MSVSRATAARLLIFAVGHVISGHYRFVALHAVYTTVCAVNETTQILSLPVVPNPPVHMHGYEARVRILLILPKAAAAHNNELASLLERARNSARRPNTETSWRARSHGQARLASATYKTLIDDSQMSLTLSTRSRTPFSNLAAAVCCHVSHSAFGAQLFDAADGSVSRICSRMTPWRAGAVQTERSWKLAMGRMKPKSRCALHFVVL